MSMSRQLWSINGLAVELCSSPRTLSKRLADLQPDEEKMESGKLVRRWSMARVVAHLYGNGQSEESRNRELYDCDEELVCRHLFPAVLASRYFRGLTINYLRHEIGVPTVDALRAYKAACLGMGYAFAEFFQGGLDSLEGRAEREEIPIDDLTEIDFTFPACFEELKSLGPEAYAAKYWPDKAA